MGILFVFDAKYLWNRAKKGLFFRCFRKLNHGQRTTFIKGLSPDSKKTPQKSWIRGHRTVQTAHCALHWIALLALSLSIEFVSSSARVTSVKFAQVAHSLSE